LAFVFLRGFRAVAAKDNVVQEGREKTCRKEWVDSGEVWVGFLRLVVNG
jgi:hypothetical protein